MLATLLHKNSGHVDVFLQLSNWAIVQCTKETRLFGVERSENEPERHIHRPNPLPQNADLSIDALYL